MKFDIVISHYKNIELLQRTLLSLSKVSLPDSLNKIHLVENGMDSGANNLLIEFKSFNLPIIYHYEAEASLVAARNRGIKESDADFIIFFDNDLKFNTSILTAYADAFESYGQDYYFGGPVEPDYEQIPPANLLEYMPFSVKGFNLGNENKIVESTFFFLGANHALSRTAINKMQDSGAVYSGAGASGEQGGVGEEKRLQQTLDKIGFKGVYIANAIILHHIPASVGTLDWVSNRYYRYGLEDAEDKKKFINAKKLFGIPGWVLKGYIKTNILSFLNKIQGKDKLYIHYHTEQARFKGIIDALSKHPEN